MRCSCARRAAWTPRRSRASVAEPVRQALALLESALAHGPGFEPATSTRAFRFYMSDLGQIEFLPPLVERVQRDRARACASKRWRWTSRTSATRSAAGALDLAVGFLPALGPPVERHPLFRDPYVA